jgi:hypothetical protein
MNRHLTIIWIASFFISPVATQDYQVTQLHNLLRDNNEQHNRRYSTGFTFKFGIEKQATPLLAEHTKTCPDGSTILADTVCPKQDLGLRLAASSGELCPGDIAQVTASISGGERNQLNYQWLVNNKPVSQAKSLVFESFGRQPGFFVVALRLSGTSVNPVSAARSITVLEYQPPTGTASASPARVKLGEKSQLSASFEGQCGGTIQAPTFTASAGSIHGDQFDSRNVFFDPSERKALRKTVTITASAADNRSVGTAITTLEVVRKVTIVPIRLSGRHVRK